LFKGDITQGQIIKIHSDFYYVEANGKLFECKLREVIKKQQADVFVGDYVEFSNGYITSILARKNYIKRPAVANIDQIVIVSAVEEPHLDLHQLDRYIAFAEYYGIDIKLCFNKNDLSMNDSTIENVFSIYEPMGYDIIFTSALEGFGIDDFKEIMQNKTSVLCGASGVGKSSLLNAINSNIKLKTGSVSDKTGRGTHTTRHCEIINLSENTRIIDTPGFSNLKFDFIMPHDLAKLFREMRPLIRECKFQDCLHLLESGCAIKENENISQSRYDSYAEFVKEAKEYKEKVKFQGKKKETFSKQNNNKTTVKISSRKRAVSRNTMKQRLKDEEET